MGDQLTHLDAAGQARMADVSGKPVIARSATATGRVLLSARALAVLIEVTARTAARTGVEMEALTAVCVGALALVDMAKPSTQRR